VCARTSGRSVGRARTRRSSCEHEGPHYSEVMDALLLTAPVVHL